MQFLQQLKIKDMYTVLVIVHFFTAPANTIGMDKKQAFVHNNITHARYIEYLYGIPVYLTLAQSALESGWGTSKVCAQNNNCFGIKLGDSKEHEWQRTTKRGAKWRKYATQKQSFLDYGLYLEERIGIPKIPKGAYVRWCNWIGNSGYATSKSYARKLKATIKANKWHLL